MFDLYKWCTFMGFCFGWCWPEGFSWIPPHPLSLKFLFSIHLVLTNLGVSFYDILFIWTIYLFLHSNGSFRMEVEIFSILSPSPYLVQGLLLNGYPVNNSMNELITLSMLEELGEVENDLWRAIKWTFTF